MTDVLITVDGGAGEITVEDGFIALTDNFETAIAVSLLDGDQWSANAIIDNENERATSQFEKIAKGAPQSSRGLVLIEDAAAQDLEWLIDEGAASSLNVNASFPDRASVALEVVVTNNNNIEERFQLNWERPA